MTALIFKHHHSQQDQSVNFEHRFEDHPGMLEARYVRRVDDYFIVYLSSQTGCKQACRMCWLTATGQTNHRDTTVEEYLQQAEEVFAYYREQAPAKLVHFNFMARGDALASNVFLDNADTILAGLAAIATRHGLKYKFLVSTIFPKTMTGLKLNDIFRVPELYPEIYYSLYTTNRAKRKRWLGKAMDVPYAMDLLQAWQLRTKKVPKIHFAFIEGVNDNYGEMLAIGHTMKAWNLKVNLNIVRYNPPTPEHSKEPEEAVIQNLTAFLVKLINPERWRIVPRVGTDVMASCGTFLK